MAVAELEDAEVAGDVVERLAFGDVEGPAAPGGTGPGRVQPRKECIQAPDYRLQAPGSAQARDFRFGSSGVAACSL